MDKHPIHVTLRAQGPGLHVLELDVEAADWWAALVEAKCMVEHMPMAMWQIETEEVPA